MYLRILAFRCNYFWQKKFQTTWWQRSHRLFQTLSDPMRFLFLWWHKYLHTSQTQKVSTRIKNVLTQSMVPPVRSLANNGCLSAANCFVADKFNCLTSTYSSSLFLTRFLTKTFLVFLETYLVKNYTQQYSRLRQNLLIAAFSCTVLLWLLLKYFVWNSRPSVNISRSSTH